MISVACRPSGPYVPAHSPARSLLTFEEEVSPASASCDRSPPSCGVAPPSVEPAASTLPASSGADVFAWRSGSAVRICRARGAVGGRGGRGAGGGARGRRGGGGPGGGGGGGGGDGA